MENNNNNSNATKMNSDFQRSFHPFLTTFVSYSTDMKKKWISEELSKSSQIIGAKQQIVSTLPSSSPLQQTAQYSKIVTSLVSVVEHPYVKIINPNFVKSSYNENGLNPVEKLKAQARSVFGDTNKIISRIQEDLKNPQKINDDFLECSCLITVKTSEAFK